MRNSLATRRHWHGIISPAQLLDAEAAWVQACAVAKSSARKKLRCPTSCTLHGRWKNHETPWFQQTATTSVICRTDVLWTPLEPNGRHCFGRASEMRCKFVSALRTHGPPAACPKDLWSRGGWASGASQREWKAAMRDVQGRSLYIIQKFHPPVSCNGPVSTSKMDSYWRQVKSCPPPGPGQLSWRAVDAANVAALVAWQTWFVHGPTAHWEPSWLVFEQVKNVLNDKGRGKAEGRGKNRDSAVGT